MYQHCETLFPTTTNTNHHHASSQDAAIGQFGIDISKPVFANFTWDHLNSRRGVCEARPRGGLFAVFDASGFELSLVDAGSAGFELTRRFAPAATVVVLRLLPAPRTAPVVRGLPPAGGGDNVSRAGALALGTEILRDLGAMVVGLRDE
ncbi:hypothetical protein BC938DRAFT_476269 [Jimgerdemannia flammicorona]|uniref:Uncharacterized protein n=1 Tax=Jimgerdemannia flammicorona TaxID=994334 RepID=A0A433QQM8_9FUNG|nr:hypothetical protein BC938DRAFT_476269 [Jimgerdemannia flammicorona]